MDIQYAPGTTDRQRAVVADAFNFTYFPWTLIPTVVTVEFTTDTESLAAIHGGKAEAQTDTSGLPDTATIKVHPGLIEPGSSRYYFGEKFAWETIIHELGHVVGFQLPDASLRAIAALYAPACDFDTQWAITTSWPHAGQEAFAEIFKDIWLPKSLRQYDNRTDFKINCGQIQDFAKAIGEGLGAGSSGGSIHLPTPASSTGGVAPDGGFPTLAWTGIPIGAGAAGLTWPEIMQCDLQLTLQMIELRGADTPGSQDRENAPVFFLTAVPGVTSMPTYDEVLAALPGYSSAVAGGFPDGFGMWVWTSETIGQFPMSSLPITLPSDGYLIWGSHPQPGLLPNGVGGSGGSFYDRFARHGVSEITFDENPANYTSSLVTPPSSTIPIPRCPYGDLLIGGHGGAVLRGEPSRIHGRYQRRPGGGVAGGKFPVMPSAASPPPSTH